MQSVCVSLVGLSVLVYGIQRWLFHRLLTDVKTAETDAEVLHALLSMASVARTLEQNSV